MSDPIAAALTQIRNSNAVDKKTCIVRYAKFNEQLLKILQDNSYIDSFQIVSPKNTSKYLKIKLIPGKIRRVVRISKPGRRVYVGHRNIPIIMRGLGTVVMSTPNGLLTGEEAKSKKVGGEIIMEIV